MGLRQLVCLNFGWHSSVLAKMFLKKLAPEVGLGQDIASR